MNIEHRQSFLEIARTWLCLGYFLDVRYISVERNKRCEILRGLVTLNPLPPTADVSFAINAAGLLAGQLQRPAGTPDELLYLFSRACSGILDVAGHELTIESLPQNFFSENIDLYREQVDLHLRISSDTYTQLTPAEISTVNNALRWTSTPFDGLADLSRWLGMEDPSHFGRGPTIDIRINPPVDVASESVLREDVFTLRLRALADYDVSQVQIAITTTPGIGLSRLLVSDKVAWRPGATGLLEGVAEINCPNADLVVCMLGLGNTTVRRHAFVDKSRARTIRLAATRSFDPDLQLLQTTLTGGGGDSKRFEKGVASLLFLYGFAPASPVDTDAPDLLVMSPGGRIAIIECTLKTSDFVAKVSKLAARKNKLVADMLALGHSADVYAVLVCGCTRNDLVAANDDELAKHGVTLLTREHLRKALEEIQHPKDPDLLLEDAKALMQAHLNRRPT